MTVPQDRADGKIYADACFSPLPPDDRSLRTVPASPVQCPQAQIVANTATFTSL